MKRTVLSLFLSLSWKAANGKIIRDDFFTRMLAGEASGCRAGNTPGQCTSVSPHPQCTPFRSIDYCATDESFQTYISSRTEVVQKNPSQLGNYWFNHLEDKLAGYKVAASLGLNPPKIYDCSNDLDEMSTFDPPTPGQGIVVRATSLHSNKGIYVLPDGFGGQELIRDVVMDKMDVVSDLQSLNVKSYVIEEYIPSPSVAPMEFKFHMIGGNVASINVVANRGSDCACWAEIDVAQTRLDQYGCFTAGGSEQKVDQCTRIDYQSGVDRAHPMKGMDLCSDLPLIDECVLKDMEKLAKKASAAIGVYVRVDMFLGANGEIHVQEFSTNHMNGLRHCSAKLDVNGCVDPCYQGRLWKDAAGSNLFGGPETEMPQELKEWLALPSDDAKCANIESTQIVAPPATTCVAPTPAPIEPQQTILRTSGRVPANPAPAPAPAPKPERTILRTSGRVP